MMGEFRFLKLYSQRLKVEHQGNYAIFLNLDITFLNNIFVYKLFDKIDAFSFIIVQTPYIDVAVHKLFYSTVKEEFFLAILSQKARNH